MPTGLSATKIQNLPPDLSAAIMPFAEQPPAGDLLFVCLFVCFTAPKFQCICDILDLQVQLNGKEGGNRRGGKHALSPLLLMMAL